MEENTMDNFDPNMMKAISDSLPTSTKQKLFDPSADAIGKGLGGILMWVFQKPIEFGIIKQKQFEDLSNKIAKEYSKIPEEKRTDSKKGLMIKTLESARYSMDDETLRSYFAKLLTSTANADNTHKITPIFSTILSNMDVLDAQFISLFKKTKRLPMCDAKMVITKEYASNHKKNLRSFLDLRNNLTQTTGFPLLNENFKSIDLFNAFGIIKIQPGLSMDTFEKSYVQIEEFYKILLESLMQKQNKELNEKKFDKIIFEHGLISLTDLGMSFVDCVIP